MQIGHNNPPSETEIIREHLEKEHNELTQRAHDLVDAAERLPTIEDAVTAGKVGDYIKQINNSLKKIEDARKTEKEPYLRKGQLVDAFFNGYKSVLEIAKKKAQNPLDEFARKEALRIQREREQEAERKRLEAQAELERAAALEAENKPVLADAVFDQAKLADKNAQKAEQLALSGSGLVKTYGSESQTNLRTVWVATITDIQKIDLEALRPYFSEMDIQKALNGFMKAGGRNIRGAKIEQKSSAVVR